MNIFESVFALFLWLFLTGAIVFVGMIILETVVEISKQPYRTKNWREFEKKEKKNVKKEKPW